MTMMVIFSVFICLLLSRRQVALLDIRDGLLILTFTFLSLVLSYGLAMDAARGCARRSLHYSALAVLLDIARYIPPPQFVCIILYCIYYHYYHLQAAFVFDLFCMQWRCLASVFLDELQHHLESMQCRERRPQLQETSLSPLSRQCHSLRDDQGRRSSREFPGWTSLYASLVARQGLRDLSGLAPCRRRGVLASSQGRMAWIGATGRLLGGADSQSAHQAVLVCNARACIVWKLRG